MSAASETGNLMATIELVASTRAFWLVVIGGMLGGFLQPVVAQLNPKTPSPERKHYWLSPLLGVAAAGISVFLVANTDQKEPLRLLFFAVLCGLAFPAVLTSAVDNLSKKTNDMQKEVSEIADKARSNDPAVLASAASDLRQTMVANPANSIKPESQRSIETSAELALRNIAQTVSDDPAQAREIVEQLKEVATVAQSAGYTETAQRAGVELEKLSQLDDVKDKDAKNSAGEAAKRIMER